MKIKVWPALTVITTIALVVYVSFYAPKQEAEKENLPPKELHVEVSPTLLYGYPIDSFSTTEGEVRWNQNLSEILSNHNVPYQDLHVLSKASKKVYDVRKLKAGSKYTIIHENDSLKTARQFIFEPSLTEYVVYNFSDSIYAKVHTRETTTAERTVAVEVRSSVYESLLDQNASPLLVSKLVDVFAWQVDFFRIAKGDRLKVIFDEEKINDDIVGIGDIKAAYFEHWGKSYYAIPYSSEEEQTDYFDEEGNSLRKTFLRAPLRYSRISSRYSLRRYHPVQRRYKAHLGTDYAAPTGTPIRTVGDGVVLEARYHGGNGNYVKIKHNSNYTTQYLHMSKIARGIKPGVKVKQGTTIGYVGSTGLATGPHLCFRFWKNGRQVDALKVDLPSSKGIEKDELPDFLVVADSIKHRLDLTKFPESEPLLAVIKYPLPTID